MANRLQVTTPDWSAYDTLIAEAALAFQQDIVYAITVVESARSVAAKKQKALQRIRSKV